MNPLSLNEASKALYVLGCVQSVEEWAGRRRNVKIHGLELGDFALDLIFSVPRGIACACFLAALASSMTFCHSGTTSIHSCLHKKYIRNERANHLKIIYFIHVVVQNFGARQKQSLGV